MRKYTITDGTNSVVTTANGKYIAEPDGRCNLPTATFTNKGEAAQLMREDFADFENMRVEPIECEDEQPRKITGAETRLERHVQKWINEQAVQYDTGINGVLEDLFHGGCASGYVSHLIYYTDTLKFFQTHRRDISALLAEMCQNTNQQPSEMFGVAWDKEDPFAQETQNRNLLAWFGFERAAQILADRNGIEI